MELRLEAFGHGLSGAPVAVSGMDVRDSVAVVPLSMTVEATVPPRAPPVECAGVRFGCPLERASSNLKLHVSTGGATLLRGIPPELHCFFHQASGMLGVKS